MFKLEADMQKWLSDNLSEIEGLSEIIDDFEETIQGKSDVESRIISSYKHCLKSLNLNVVISENENISNKEGDRLCPDFLLYAPETESFVILELKNIPNPTRQVGTELGAYSSEIKSYVPFISEGDIIHVVISRDWPTLLRHYLFNEIFWRQKNILCLEPYKSAKGSIMLRALPPKILIEDDVSLMISERHLGGYQLCLYDDLLYAEGSRDRLDQHIEQFKTAIFAMASKGNSQKNHGFAFLWKDHRPISLSPYSITILNFAPFQSLERYLHSMDGGYCIPEITRRLIKIAVEYDPIGHGQSLNQIVDYGERFLKGVCSPCAEGFANWDVLKSIMLENSTLIEFHPWGVFSELLSDKLASEYDKGNHSIELTDPELGLELINELIDIDYNFIDLTYYDYTEDDEV
ncbi:hypothetical protein [Aeromonas jandaei]|uniref:hypothetical protein n=1 Tax=Aeromonas jandaei TaxID=650 RepID=UPI00191D2B15|nr:hypothetical protein [Aeromonas jandaei]MBL0627949.1 hypothetical protein [Aeromonas jandaei]